MPLAQIGRFIEDAPARALAILLALHAAVWAALPTWLYPNLPLDLIEALTYGPEWQLGYDKLPPLPWWLIEVVHRAIGYDFAFYLLAQIAVIGGFIFVWKTARPLIGAVGAFASVLIVDGMHYFNYTAPKFNHDVIELPLWALAGFAYHAALTRGRSLDWVLLGATFGIAVWAKYFFVVLAVPLVLFLLLDREARQSLRTPGPYIAGVLTLLIALPHVLWLIDHDFVPVNYVDARARPTHTAWGHILGPVEFLGGQVAWLVPSLLIALSAFYPVKREPQRVADARDYRIVSLIVFGPLAVVLFMSAITARLLVAMWGYPLWLFFGLWLVMTLRVLLDRARLMRLTAAWGVIAVAYVAAFIVNYAVMPYYDHRYRASLFPGSRLAAEMETRFAAATGQPLTYVVSSMWLGGNIHHYGARHARTLIDARPIRAPWIDLADLRKRGAVVVWVDRDLSSLPPGYEVVAPGAELQPPLELPMRFGNGAIKVGWAILRPATPPP